jgi:hypothetical protein
MRALLLEDQGALPGGAAGAGPGGAAPGAGGGAGGGDGGEEGSGSDEGGGGGGGGGTRADRKRDGAAGTGLGPDDWRALPPSYKVRGRGVVCGRGTGVRHGSVRTRGVRVQACGCV